MKHRRTIVAGVTLVAQAWLGVRSVRAWSRLPRLHPADASVTAACQPSDPATISDDPPFLSATPSVSIIVPARNEAATLPTLLPSLLGQRYPAFDVTVVDDDSTDETAMLARGLGTRVVSAGALPRGWAGKPHACVVGAQATDGEWLLFTDADTQHTPDALAAAVAYARRHGLESLSLLPAQRCVTLWERLLLPYAYSHLFAGVDARAIHDPIRRTSLLNGQYLLIHRASYERAGTHAAVRASIVEDVDLGAILKQCGIRHQTVRAEGLVSVRMYTGLRAIIAGFSKNSFRFAQQEPRRGVAVIASTTLAAAPTLRLLLLLLRCRHPDSVDTATVAFGYAVAVAALAPWQRRFGTHPAWAVAQPVTALLFTTISLGGIWSALVRNQTRWKGRRY